MKRLAAFLLSISFLLSGCQFLGNRIKEPVSFYYLRSNYQEDLSGIIASEEREASGHRKDLPYLMALYMMGPINEQLKTPLPFGTRISVETQSEKSVVLKLSDAQSALTDVEFSAACACLAYTCMDIIGVSEVTVNAGNRSITITDSNLSLLDTMIQPTTEEQK